MAAVFLHDITLEGENPQSEEDIRINSAETAGTFLERIGWNDTDIGRVQGAILENTQSSPGPTTLEGKILKDADFLANLGAEGIIRAIAEMAKGKNVEDVIKMFDAKMPTRIQDLEFPESKEVAKAKWKLVSIFLHDEKHGVLTIKGAREILSSRKHRPV